MTVSNAYNRPDQLSEGTRARVLRVAAELGYGGPDPAGRSLRRGRSGTVGVVLTDHLAKAFGDPGMVSFLHGLATALGEAGQALLLVPVEESGHSQLLRDAVVDGFVLVGVPIGSPVVDEVRSRRLPMVTAGSLRLPATPNVGVDDVTAAAGLAEHLLTAGHRTFGIVTVAVREAADPGRTSPVPPVAFAVAPGRAAEATRHGGFRRRVEGCLRAFAAAGVPDDSVRTVGVLTNDRVSGRAAAELLAAGEPRPTAVVCVTDILALGVLDAAADAGRRVPDDLSVAGFDGIEEAARAGLTTVRQDLFGQGRTAAELLLARLAGRRPRSVRRPAALWVGGTTGPPSRR